MDLQAAITLFLTVLGFAMKPGPGMTTVMSRTMAQGMPGCLAFMAGFSIVTTCYLVMVFVGLSFLKDNVLFISIFLKAVTAAYLIYLGIKGLQNPDVHISMHMDKEVKLFDTFTAGLMVTFSNPLVIVFYGVLLPSIIHIETLGVADMIIVIAIVLLVEVAVAVLYSLPIAYARDTITPQLLRKVSIVSCVVLIVVGLVIGVSAFPAHDVLSLQ